MDQSLCICETGQGRVRHRVFRKFSEWKGWLIIGSSIEGDDNFGKQQKD